MQCNGNNTNKVIEKPATTWVQEFSWYPPHNDPVLTRWREECEIKYLNHRVAESQVHNEQQRPMTAIVRCSPQMLLSPTTAASCHEDERTKGQTQISFRQTPSINTQSRAIQQSVSFTSILALKEQRVLLATRICSSRPFWVFSSIHRRRRTTARNNNIKPDYSFSESSSCPPPPPACRSREMLSWHFCRQWPSPQSHFYTATAQQDSLSLTVYRSHYRNCRVSQFPTPSIKIFVPSSCCHRHPSIHPNPPFQIPLHSVYLPPLFNKSKHWAIIAVKLPLNYYRNQSDPFGFSNKYKATNARTQKHTLHATTMPA